MGSREGEITPEKGQSQSRAFALLYEGRLTDASQEARGPGRTPSWDAAVCTHRTAPQRVAVPGLWP